MKLVERINMIEPQVYEYARSILRGLNDLPITEGHEEACEAIRVWYLKCRIEAMINDLNYVEE